MQPVQPLRRRSELSEALTRYRAGFIAVAVLSALLNVLVLGGSIYMMLVYDLALPSGSGSTLVGLLVMVIIVYAFQGVIDVVRGRILMRIGGIFADSFAKRIYGLMLRVPSAGAPDGSGRAVRDLDQIRAFLSGPGPTAMIDLPWIVFFLAVLCLFHPLLALTTSVGALILVALTIITDRATKRLSISVGEAGQIRQIAADEAERNAETIRALGMGGRLSARWEELSSRHLAVYLRLSETTNTLSTTSRMFRMLLQSCVLATGAALVINDRASSGVIFASSILSSRALAPVEIAIAQWRGYTAARQAWGRLATLFDRVPAPAEPMPLPAPKSGLSCEALTLLPPGGTRPVVAEVSFTVPAGKAVGVIGPSASGKSSLVRGLAGVWPAVRGAVRLDGAALDQWNTDALGRHIGYLAQTVQLLSGTIAQNIARFDPEAHHDAVIAAAQAAGVHDLIVRLPQGYETQVGRDGDQLSAGQRQRVALARAMFGDPFLILLDEPNSNLDTDGERALSEAVSTARDRGAIVVLVAHRAAILEAVDFLLVMEAGRAVGFGPRDAVLARLQANASARVVPVDPANPANRRA